MPLFEPELVAAFITTTKSRNEAGIDENDTDEAELPSVMLAKAV